MTPAQQLSNNPQIKFLQTRYNHTVDPAAEKLTVHLKDPQQYPLPPANKKSLERAMYDVMMTLSEKNKTSFWMQLKAIKLQLQNKEIKNLATWPRLTFTRIK